MDTQTLTTWGHLKDESLKKIAYDGLYTASFILLATVSNPLFDETAHTMQVEVELSDGQEYTVHMNYSDLVGSDHMQEGFTGRLIRAIETAAKRA
jgi:hypothetical protein